MQTRGEVTLLREELHAALDGLRRDTNPWEFMDLLPPGLHWVTAGTQRELHEIVSKLSRPPAASVALPEVVVDIPGIKLRSGSSLLRHSLEREAISGAVSTAGHGAKLLKALASVVPSDFPVAMLYRVPKEPVNTPGPGAGAGSTNKASDKSRGRQLQTEAAHDPLALTRMADDYSLRGNIEQTMQTVQNVHAPLLARAEEKKKSGGRYAEMASPLGDGLRLLAAQEAAIEEVRKMLRSEISRLTYAITAVGHRADEALMLAKGASPIPATSAAFATSAMERSQVLSSRPGAAEPIDSSSFVENSASVKVVGPSIDQAEVEQVAEEADAAVSGSAKANNSQAEMQASVAQPKQEEEQAPVESTSAGVFANRSANQVIEMLSRATNTLPPDVATPAWDAAMSHAAAAPAKATLSTSEHGADDSDGVVNEEL